MKQSFDGILLGAVLTVAILFSRDTTAAEAYQEQYRPQFHFTPGRNWMNDPNGLVFFEGEYHLFYQYNPFGDRWGHMSWGHAVSRDLMYWEHLPVALGEENGVMIFSGSAVVDWKNTSGFGRSGTPPLVAIYTGHYTEKPLQNQQIAFSNDRGRTWTKYSQNPVLDIGEKDFRDPKVFWHEATQRWIMVVSLPPQRKVRFYASPNLKEWSLLSDFGPAGAVKGIWECPDLFPVPVEGNSKRSKWVLIVNVGSAAPAGGSGCQYFVGDFDGTRFTRDAAILAEAPARATNEAALWADYGRDFYAGVSWSDIPRSDGRRLWIGWMSNWEYAQNVPTSPWRSAMSLPRELTLRTMPEGFQLVQQPARELRKLRGRRHRLRNASLGEANAWLQRNAIASDLLEIAVEFESVEKTGNFGLKLRTGDSESLVMGCDLAQRRAYLDRAHTGQTNFHAKFAGIHEAPLRRRDGVLRLRAIVDTSSVEVFFDEGEAVITDLFFPTSNKRELEVFSIPDQPRSKVRNLDVWELKSVWK